MNYTTPLKTFVFLSSIVMLFGGVSADLELKEFQTNPKDVVNISDAIEIYGQINDVSKPTSLEIILSKSGNSQEYAVETDEDGYFSKNVFAPYSTGEYSIKLRQNGVEIENSFSRNIKIVSHPDIEIETPDKVEIFDGNTEKVPIEVTNTGQEKITSMDINIENEELDLNSSNSLGGLGRGRTTKTDFKLNIGDAKKSVYKVNTTVKVFTQQNKTLTKFSSFKLEKLTISDITGQKTLESSEEESNETGEVTLTEENSNEERADTPIVGQLTVDEGLSLEILTPVILTVLLGYLSGKVSTKKGLVGQETPKASGFNTPKKTVKVPEYAEEEGKFMCKKTGKSFKSKKGLELYQKMNNLE